MAVIYTIGHSVKKEVEFVKKLEENKIEVLVDIRTIPFSKWNPQFNRPSLEVILPLNNIKYIYRGKNLGGKFGKEANVDYDAAIDQLVRNAPLKRICIMCSEGGFENCHRHIMIEPDLVKKGVEVKHILWAAKEKKEKIDLPSLFE